MSPELSPKSSPEPFVSRAKALPAKRSEKGYGDENEKETAKKLLLAIFCLRNRAENEDRERLENRRFQEGREDSRSTGVCNEILVF